MQRYSKGREEINCGKINRIMVPSISLTEHKLAYDAVRIIPRSCLSKSVNKALFSKAALPMAPILLTTRRSATSGVFSLGADLTSEI